jgi:hypothetical protein
MGNQFGGGKHSPRSRGARFQKRPLPIRSEGIMRPCVHFVGFRDERYWNAVAVFGRPDFIHKVWDRRSQREIGEGDLIVFATGDESQPFAKNADDIDETKLL